MAPPGGSYPYWPPVPLVIADGFTIDDPDGVPPAHPALISGVKLKFSGQPNNTARLTAGAAPTFNELAAPAAGPTLAHSAAATVLLAGDYYVAYTYATTSGETAWSPRTKVTIVAGEKITMTGIAFPAGVTSVIIYFQSCPAGVNYGKVGTQTVTSTNTDITVGGNGAFPPMLNQGLGSIQVPVAAAGGITNLTASLTPAAVAASISAEQAHTVSGAAVGDLILGIQQPSAQTAGLGIVGQRVSGANTINVEWGNFTTASKTPVSGTYGFSLWRNWTKNTLTVLDSLVTAASHINFSLRQGTTVPSAQSLITAYVSALTPGTGFTLAFMNIGQVWTLVTDFILDYEVVN